MWRCSAALIKILSPKYYNLVGNIFFIPSWPRRPVMTMTSALLLLLLLNEPPRCLPAAQHGHLGGSQCSRSGSKKCLHPCTFWTTQLNYHTLKVKLWTAVWRTSHAWPASLIRIQLHLLFAPASASAAAAVGWYHWSTVYYAIIDTLNSKWFADGYTVVDYGLCSFRLALAIMQEPRCVFSCVYVCEGVCVCRRAFAWPSSCLGFATVLYYKPSTRRPPKASPTPRPCRKRTTDDKQGTMGQKSQLSQN